MATEFTESVSIGASPDVVYGFLTNVNLSGKYLPGLIRAELLTDGRFGVGTRFRVTRKVSGKSTTETYEVVEAERPRRLALLVDGKQGTSGRGRYDYVYVLTPEDDGTRLELRGRVSDVPWFGELLGRLSGGGIRKTARADITALKEYIESQSPNLRHSTAAMPVFTPPNAKPALRRDD